MSGLFENIKQAASALIPPIRSSINKKEIIRKIEAKGMTLEQLFETTKGESKVRRLGKQVFKFTNPPKIIGSMSVVGPKESKGPLKEYFGYVYQDDKCGKKTYEEAERTMLEKAVKGALSLSGLGENNLDAVFAGDLLNQIVSANYTAKLFDSAFFGLYGACSTMAESLVLASILIDAGFISTAACATGSHFSTAERQFRGPLEYGSQRPQYSQWTVTGSGCSILAGEGDGPRITHAAVGRVVDYGVKDIANMGAAMAPAAMDTFTRFFIETGYEPKDFDLIVTGDLGALGGDILRILMERRGIELGQVYSDCGQIIFDCKQGAYQGGSGCGCSAVVLNGYIMEMFKCGMFKRVLFGATGALMSLLTSQQGDTIPGICHAVMIER